MKPAEFENNEWMYVLWQDFTNGKHSLNIELLIPNLERKQSLNIVSPYPKIVLYYI